MPTRVRQHPVEDVVPIELLRIAQPEFLNVETNQAAIRAEQAKAIAAGAKQREQIWELLRSESQQIRVKMLGKLCRDFEVQR